MESSSSSKTLEGSAKMIFKLQAALSQKDHEIQEKDCAEQLAQDLESLEVPEEQLEQITQVNFLEPEPEWLEKFLERTFFEPCPTHPIRRNELNKYCIDCDAPLCQFCVSIESHDDHRLLKIYRHVYKDVVPLDEIERHIDCSLIQPYRCNKQLVIALSPLPHSGTSTNEEVTCQTCNRKLIEYDVYNFCSISCKVEALAKAREELPSPPTLLEQPEQPEQNANEDEPQPPMKKTRRRKGIPRRSPFF